MSKWNQTCIPSDTIIQYFTLFILLATSFGLNRPSSGQYLQKLKKGGAYGVTRQFYGVPFTFIISLYNYYQLLVVLSVVSFCWNPMIWVLYMYYQSSCWLTTLILKLYIVLKICSITCVIEILNTIYTILKKVKWSRYRPGVAQRVGRGIALLFHDRGARRGWVVSSTPRPHFTPGKDSVPILQEAGWAPWPVWTGGKSRPHRDSIPDRPARSQSLYRLRYK